MIIAEICQLSDEIRTERFWIRNRSGAYNTTNRERPKAASSPLPEVTLACGGATGGPAKALTTGVRLTAASL
jgi:hypothetical protein